MTKQQAWEAAGNTGKAPEGWYGPGGNKDNPNYGGGGGGSSVAQATADAIAENYNTFQQREKDFANANPWDMDKVLSEEAAKVKQRLDPYYNQTLGNFLQGIEVKKARSLEDERNLLGQLTQTTDRYNQQQKDVLKNSLDTIDQSNASNDLSSSGFGERQQGNTLADTQLGLEAYNQNAGNTARQAQLQGQRTRGYDLPMQTQLEKQQLGAEQTANEYAQTYGQTQQRQNQYQFNQQRFAGQIPGASNLNSQTDLYKLLGNPSVQQ